MKAATKRRMRQITGKHLSPVRRVFLKRHGQGYEIALYARARDTLEAEIWRRVDATGELWERLSRHPIEGPVDRRALVAQLERHLQ